MVPMNGQGRDGPAQPGAYGQPAGRDPNAILNECRDIDGGIESIRRNMDDLRALQQQSLNSADMNPDNPVHVRRERLAHDTTLLYRNLIGRMKKIKSNPESGSPKNSAQVGRVDRTLRQAFQDYQVLERDFQRQMRAQMEREYRIVRPDATEAEVREAVADAPSSQIFSQAVGRPDVPIALRTRLTEPGRCCKATGGGRCRRR